MKKSKTDILNHASVQLAAVVKEIGKNQTELGVNIAKKESRRRFVSSRDRQIEEEVLKYNIKRADELAKLIKSPYFFKCRLKFDDTDKTEDVFIAKYNFSEEHIYSWFSSISKLRFETIGKFSYTLPDGTERQGSLFQKDQFMIAEGKIVYMASEAESYARELIYQEHLSNRKNGFILPEVIAKMEKSQDEVIRADYQGSYLISGPAGSGKTTLALHRVAYLAKSPDTSENFQVDKIILFVQDESTLEYFQSIFPQLGIEDVIITTFPNWAFEMLEIADFTYVYRYGESDRLADEYEYAKSQALLNYNFDQTGLKINRLTTIYDKFFSQGQLLLFAKQLVEKKLDRFDLAFLLQGQISSAGPLGREERVVVEKKNGDLKLDTRFMPTKYSLIIVDEVQNYLKEEIAIIKTCINQNKSVLYTGDLAQQTKLFTLKNWEQVGEEFSQGRKIVLDKVYRNTKEILQYVQSKGYDVFIPSELRSGAEVVEREFDLKNEELNYVAATVAGKTGLTIGVLNRESAYLKVYQQKFKDFANVHVLTVAESQGVEFDLVILVGQKEREELGGDNEELKQAKQRVLRDLNYVAMTRAMEELYVCSNREG